MYIGKLKYKLMWNTHILTLRLDDGSGSLLRSKYNRLTIILTENSYIVFHNVFSSRLNTNARSCSRVAYRFPLRCL